MGFAGPFGTYPALERPVRYAFWIGLILAGYGFAIGAMRLCELFPGIARAGRWTMNALIALASAVPMTFVVAWTLVLVQPGRVVPPTQLPILFLCVAAVQIVIVVALIRPVAGTPVQTAELSQPERTEIPEESAPLAPADRAADTSEIQVSSDASPAFPAALLARVPSELGPEIIALEAEDHYVRVHTPKGSTLVLMRLSDAVGLLDEALGMRVHRSWWVARRAIGSIQRDRQRLMLRLTNGAQVPVGRMYVTAVRDGLRDR
ncbi:LytTR family DNA-binding domain-containing protein [Niveispirillum sp. KHB5.9]|uniref:LytTR family DNA-binding domain-containing protein n=1 Tax=Niveispirillum sp. KHB5.9 TaxID=3400269 RepID=UPI003A8390F0